MTRDADSLKSAVATRSRLGLAVAGASTEMFAPMPNGVEAAFGQRHRQAAIGAVVRRPREPFVRQRDEQRLQRPFGLQIERRRHAAHEIVDDLEIFASAKLATVRRRAARSHRPTHGTGGPRRDPRARATRRRR